MTAGLRRVVLIILVDTGRKYIDGQPEKRKKSSMTPSISFLPQECPGVHIFPKFFIPRRHTNKPLGDK